MALFTDGVMNDGNSLRQYDNNILSVASSEAIDLSAKATLAQQEIATELLLFLDRSSLQDPMSTLRRSIMVSDVVVTDPLRAWHAYKTLAITYRDAYNSQLNDRYQGKWKQYEQLSNEAGRKLYQVGAAIVHEPVPKANTPSLSLVAMGVTGANYYLRVAWLNRQAQEGCASDVIQAVSGDGSAVVVGISAPSYVSFWNVYAGSSPDEFQLQNAFPIPTSDTWTLPPTGLKPGRVPGNGQSPECWIADRRILPRG